MVNNFGSVGIMSIGYYVPERIVTNHEISKLVDTSDEWITEKIGVKERRIAAPKELASDMGTKAIEDACKKAGIDKEEIELVVCGTNTPDYVSPQTACLVMQKAGIHHAAGFDTRTGGCAGGVFHLDIGSQYIASGRYRTVAVVVPEVNSKFIDWEDRTTCVFFGDGAVCYILRECKKNTGIQHTILGNDPDNFYTAYVPAGGIAEPYSEYTLNEKRGFVRMDGKAVWNFAHKHVPPLIHELANAIGCDLDDVDSFIFHQANRNIIENIMGIIGQPLEKTYINVDKYGNTGGASVPLAMQEAVSSGQIQSGDLVMAVAFGAGMSFGVSAIRWCDLDDFVQ